MLNHDYDKDSAQKESQLNQLVGFLVWWRWRELNWFIK